MKTLFSIFVPVLFIGFIFRPVLPAGENVQKINTFYTAEAKKVIDAKCYGCHSITGKSQDAKDAVMWDSLPGLPKSELIGTLDDIVKVLDKNQMPPEGAIKKYPEMKMTAEESKILRGWAEATADGLMK